MSFKPKVSQSLYGLTNIVRPIMGLPSLDVNSCSSGDDFQNNAVIMDSEKMRFAQKRHRIGPLFASSYSYWQGEGYAVSQSLIKNCDDMMRKNTYRLMQQKAVWEEISKQLKKAGIKFWGLKGQDIAEALYPNPASRWAKDVDVMVAPGDAIAAAQTLIDSGFSQSNHDGKVLLVKNKIKMKISKDIGIKHQKYPSPIELHQRLLYCEPHDFSDFIRSTNPPHEFISALSKTGMFYTILHGALAYWSRLKWLVDLSFISRHIDEKCLLSLLSLAERFHCRHALIASLYWGEVIFPNSLSKAVLVQLEDAYQKDIKAQKLLHNFSDMLENDCDRATRKYWNRPDFPSASWHVFDSNLLRAQLTGYIPIAFIARQL